MDILYKLILVGKPFQKVGIGTCHIICYFQPWLVVQNIPASEDIISYAISSVYAGKLICGTIWTHDKDSGKKESYILPTDCYTFNTSPGTLYAQRLKHVLSAEALSPSKFWKIHNDTWVICVNSGHKKIIIPYFELLRVLFYNKSLRLTDYIFSQKPINSLCSPLIFPDRNNFLTGRYCIAAAKCSYSEARLLGCLLFDPQLIYAFNASQAYWQVTASKNGVLLADKADSMPVGDFGTSYFSASGYNFSHDKEEYFWVHKLTVIQYNYKFDTLLYYPLESAAVDKNKNTKKKSATKDKDLTECPDMFLLPKQRLIRSEMRNCFPESVPEEVSYGVSHSPTTRHWENVIQNTSLLPLVITRLPWAALSLRPSDYFARYDTLKISARHLDASADIKALLTNAFRKLIREFKSKNYSIKYLELNNSKQEFGKQLSVLPLNRHPPMSITAYHGQIQHFPLVEITLTNALLYIAQPFPEYNPELILLFIKQNLIQPISSEWNTLLNEITPVHHERDLKKFYRRIHLVQVKKISSNTALLALPVPSGVIKVEDCIGLTDHIVESFRKRLEFVLAVSLKYPQGLTPEQQRKITRLSKNICRAPKWIWESRIINMWREMALRKA